MHACVRACIRDVIVVVGVKWVYMRARMLLLLLLPVRVRVRLYVVCVRAYVHA